MSQDGSIVERAVGMVTGPLGQLAVAVDRAALREASKGALDAADQLHELHRKAKHGLDGPAQRHPDLASSSVLTEFAESWRERRRQVADEVESFGQLLKRITDGYDRAEEDAASLLRRLLDVPHGTEIRHTGDHR